MANGTSDITAARQRRPTGECQDAPRTPWKLFIRRSSHDLAHLKADETADGDFVTQLLADLRDVLLDADFGITLHEALVHEAVGLEKFFQHAGEDFFHGGGGLAFQTVGLRGDLALLGNNFRRDLLAGNRVRKTGGDLQRDVLYQLLEFVLARRLGLAAADGDEHADFRARVNVSRDETVAGNFQARVAGDLDVLAQLADGGFALGFAVRKKVSGDLPGNLVAEGAKRLVARNKIRFTVHFHQHAGLSAGRDELGDDAFAGFTRRLFRGARGAGFAEQIHGGLEVAVRFDERLFAFHHANARHFTEPGHICRSD